MDHEILQEVTEMVRKQQGGKRGPIWMCGDRYLLANGSVSPGIETRDVAAMLALLKIARIASGHAKDDNWIDLAGYAACGGELERVEPEGAIRNG